MPELTIYYLESRSAGDLQAKTDSGGAKVQECLIKQYEYNRFLYQLVGQRWQWNERLNWSDQQWRDYAESDALRTWVIYSGGTPAGYYELHQDQHGETEIKYFGLALPFIGKGLGGFFLSHAIQSAWDWMGTNRVLVNTCSQDHPGALANYQARGMSIYLTETQPDEATG